MELKKGVYIAKKKNGEIYYRSSLTYKNKHISLGSFATEDEAHNAYLEGQKILQNKRITKDNLNKRTKFLSFEKSISLLNFRDNGMYFKTPIYLFPKHFEYYLSSDCCLKFDVDDLFYYSNHSIMRRGGHFFVAEYGMQVNIQNRYGIKNYAIPGKDFIFKNGDETDYRYQNIKIINKYMGVSKSEMYGRTFYTAKIHINGDFLIGRYTDEKDAAIAYNKAIDILEEKNISKNYTRNYIDNLSSVEYAKRYNSIKISNKIREL